MSDFSQSYGTSVGGSVEECFAVLIDFAAYPDWSAAVTECRILDRHPDGLPRRVAFALDMTLKTVRYVLEYNWTKPQGGTWRLVEGDMKSVEGSYQFAAAGTKTTATCTQSVDVGFWIPGPIRRTFERKALQDSVDEFRKAVEKRTAGAKRG